MCPIAPSIMRKVERPRTSNLINPIEVKIDKHTGVMGAGGVPYVKKHFCVYRGSRRVTTAIQLGYTHIEGVIID